MLITLGKGITSHKTNTSITPSSTPLPLAIDAPISASMNSAGDGLHAFAPDRVVNGYAGNTVRLARSSDNAQEDFGFDSDGYFDITAVETWAGNDDITALKMYDQTGNGGSCDNDGTIEFRTSGQYFRFGADYDTSTGLLSHGNNGSYGFNLSGTGVWKVSNTTIPLSTDGLNVFALNHMNTRKAKQPNNDVVSSVGNNTTEWLLSYGTGNNNYFRNRFYSTFGTFCRLDTLNAGLTQDIGGGSDYIPQYGQFVHVLSLDNTSCTTLIYGAEDQNVNVNATAATDIQNGELDNAFLLIGGFFSNASGDVHANERGDMTNGAIIVTTSLNQKDKYFVQEKLGAIGQQHRLKSKPEIESYFDEIIYFNNTSEAINGKRTYTGINNLLSLDFYDDTNTTSIFNTTDPQNGLNCIRIPDQDGDNGFRATSNYFAGVTTGSIMAFWNPDIPSNQLAYSLTQGTQDGRSSSNTDRSFALGRDHSIPVSWNTVASSRDTNQITGNRKLADGTVIGDMAGGNTGNQANLKYNRNTSHGVIDFSNVTLTIEGYGYDNEEAWKNNDPAQPVEIDAPTGHFCAQNLSFNSNLYNRAPLLQIATFESPPEYDRADNQATREPYMLSSNNYSYVGLTGSNIGHVQSDIAHNPNGGVVDSTDDARIISSHWFDVGEGSLFAFGFKANGVFTQQQCEEIKVNLYRLFE